MSTAGAAAVALWLAALGLGAMLWASGAVAQGPWWFALAATLLSLLVLALGPLWLVPKWRHARHGPVDDLTGLPSRQEVKRRFDRLRDRREVLTIFADIDGLKAINDTYGHVAGDRCIVALAQTLQRLEPAPFVTARVGGDEFLAIMVDADEATVAQQLFAAQRYLRGHSLEAPNGLGLSMGFSFGIARASSPLPPLTQLMAQADQAMYAQKRKQQTAQAAPQQRSTAA
jgi:diguanylate cyclase (GGDEF)-like protein